MMDHRVETFESLMTPETRAAVAETRLEWENISYEQVLEDTYNAQTVEPEKDSSRAVILPPRHGEIDETRTLVLALPHLNGWTPHHYIRARVMQQIVAPNNRVVVFPNNTRGQQNYDLSTLSEAGRRRLSEGDMRPVAEKHLSTLEHLNSENPLGSLALSGYSLGGRTVLSMAIRGSDKLDEVTHLNIDEVPSKKQRTAGELQKDFMKSGGILELRRSVKESQIPALSSAMRANRMALDLTRFGVEGLKQDGKLVQEAMAGSIDLDLMRAVWKQSLQIKLGYVDGSKLFDHRSLAPITKKAIDLIRYTGKEFRGHTAGDNVINHALMANDGINPR